MHRKEKSTEMPAMVQGATGGSVERKRVEAVVETLAMAGGRGETLTEVAHDARNMVTALGLYCDLLEEPGVLASAYVHYASELRLVAAASRRLVEKIVALDTQASLPPALLPEIEEEKETWGGGFSGVFTEARRKEYRPLAPADGGGMIGNLAAELLGNRNLLAALAGPGVALTVDAQSGALPVMLNGEDLTRILVNLVKNAADAMQGKGRIQIVLGEIADAAGVVERLQVAIEDNGPGIPEQDLERIFESGYSARTRSGAGRGWPEVHRGLGLAITRSIVEAAGGRIAATNRSPRGARLEIELPVRKTGW